MGLPFICKSTICKICDIPHMKDPLCGGDYTIEGKLLSFCPDCGSMLPYLDTVDLLEPERLPSKTQRRKIGVRIAKKYNLNYKEVHRVVQEIQGDFKESLKFRLRLIFDVDI